MTGETRREGGEEGWTGEVKYVLFVLFLGKQPKDGKKPEPCKPILKVEYKTTRNG